MARNLSIYHKQWVLSAILFLDWLVLYVSFLMALGQMPFPVPDYGVLFISGLSFLLSMLLFSKKSPIKYHYILVCLQFLLLTYPGWNIPLHLRPLLVLNYGAKLLMCFRMIHPMIKQELPITASEQVTSNPVKS